MSQYVATIGFFDGVHLGHRYLIEQVKEAALARGLQSMVVTFPVHPRRVLQADYQPRLLTTKDEKLKLLAGTRVDRLVLLDFDRKMAEMTAREFMQMLHRDYAVGVLVVGYDHRFGRGRTACFEDYVAYGQELGMEVLRARELEGGASSTIVRRALSEGNVSLANKTLGYRYFLQGRVVHGFRNGRRMGFPTANLQVDEDKLVPMNGAYGVEVAVGGRVYRGMLNIGQRPTLENGEARSVEVHIFDEQMDLYDQWLCVDFLFFLRPEQKFQSLDDLRRQLETDKMECNHRFSVLI
ncbi:MAG: riboflavin biosynthesis protein RibF [Bacteroidaceae bacterium]|nr:riboflavin biosynthesis protein RibF [Bacteroidaceae bacterium]